MLSLFSLRQRVWRSFRVASAVEAGGGMHVHPPPPDGPDDVLEVLHVLLMAGQARTEGFAANVPDIPPIWEKVPIAPNVLPVVVSSAGLPGLPGRGPDN